MTKPQQAAFDRLRQKTQDLLKKRPGGAEHLKYKDVEALINNLQVYQAELEIQNEELRHAQQELARSRDRFSLFYHQAPVGYVVLDEVGMIDDVNRTFCQMMQKERSDLIQSPFARLIDAPDRSPFLARFKAFFKDPADKRMTVELCRSDHRLFTASLTGRSVSTDFGDRHASRQGVLFTITDITLQAQSQARETHIKNVLQAVLQVNQLMVAEENPEQLIQKACDTLTGTMGYYNAWIALFNENGQTVGHTASSGFNGGFEPLAGQLAAGRFPVCMHHALGRPDIWVTGSPLTACSGCPLSGAYAGRAGMTRRLAHEEHVYGVLSVSVPGAFQADREAHRLFVQLADTLGLALDKIKKTQALQTAHDIINRSPATAFVWNNAEGWPVAWVSGNVGQLFGWTAADFMSGRVAYDTVIHPEDSGRVGQEVANVSADTRADRIAHEPYRIIRSDGGIRWVEDMTYIRRDSRGAVVAYEGILKDITEYKNIQDEKRRLEQQIYQTRRLESIGRLAGGVAHDLNNLLSPIIGYSEIMLEDVDENDPIRPLIDEVSSAGLRARNLVHQLLAFSRRQALELKPTDLNGLIRDFNKLLRRTIREDITIHMILAEKLPLINADAGQLEQVIMNLAVNAQDAMPKGGALTFETGEVELDDAYAAQHQGVRPGPYVMLGVTDNGCGMDENIQKNLFEPFFTTKKKSEGTGLGLATVYGIVKQHGGNIWVYSEKGMGTTFKVYWPVSADAAGITQRDAGPPRHVHGSETVLLAEDNPQVRALVHAILKRNGYTVMVAESGQEALSMADLHRGALHLLITDVVMPGMNGKDLYKTLCERYPNLKVVYMSGYTDNVIAHHGVLEKGVAYIQKPFSLNALASKVRAVLDHGSGS